MSERQHLADYWQSARPVAVKGEGVWIIDSEGRRYLDAAGGVHVVTIGHGVGEIAEAIGRQAAAVAFATTRHFVSEPQLQLAEVIASMAPNGLNHTYFASGGSEAIELALQMAHHFHVLNGQAERTKFIGQERSYHGGTIATVSLGGHAAHRARLAPYLLPFLQAPPTPAFNADAQAFAAALDALIDAEGPDTVCAFVAEPISGTTSGAIVPPPGWYEAIADVCRRHGVLFIVDEVVTGFGRTGRNFGIDHWSVVPDILVGSKGISSGYAPLAAVVVHDRLAERFQAGPGRLPLRLTYAGNAAACAAGLAVQRYVQREGLVARAREMGAYLHERLTASCARIPQLGPVRGRGLLLGLPVWASRDRRVPFARSQRVQERIVSTALGNGLILVGGTGSDASADGDHLLLSPPLVISRDECDEIVKRLETSVLKALDEC